MVSVSLGMSLKKPSINVNHDYHHHYYYDNLSRGDHAPTVMGLLTVAKLTPSAIKTHSSRFTSSVPTYLHSLMSSLAVNLQEMKQAHDYSSSPCSAWRHLGLTVYTHR